MEHPSKWPKSLKREKSQVQRWGMHSPWEHSVLLPNSSLASVGCPLEHLHETRGGAVMLLIWSFSAWKSPTGVVGPAGSLIFAFLRFPSNFKLQKQSLGMYDTSLPCRVLCGALFCSSLCCFLLPFKLRSKQAKSNFVFLFTLKQWAIFTVHVSELSKAKIQSMLELHVYLQWWLQNHFVSSLELNQRIQASQFLRLGRSPGAQWCCTFQSLRHAWEGVSALVPCPPCRSTAAGALTCCREVSSIAMYNINKVCICRVQSHLGRSTFKIGPSRV